MHSRHLTFRVDNAYLINNTYGKRQFGGSKNRNSIDFILDNKSSNPSPSPKPRIQKTRSKAFSPSRILETYPTQPQTRILRLEEIRKKINLKIFELGNPPAQTSTNAPIYHFTPPPLKRISPEKFIESITYTKADLQIPSKFIPTDRNSNKLLDMPFKPLFPMPVYTKKYPKPHRGIRLDML